MPGLNGMDQTGEEYAPHWYINHQYVGDTVKTVVIGRWEYRIGRIENEQVVCERSLVTELGGSAKRVKLEDIPANVMRAITSVSFKESKAMSQSAIEEFERLIGQ